MTLPRLVMAFATLAMSIAAPLAARTPAPPAPAPPAPAVSIRQASVEDPGHRRIPVAIVSPAAGTGLPLIILSHGTGAAMVSHIDTALALAEAGFVVVAPMHPGDNYQDDSTVGTPAWLASRARHVSTVVDFMFAQWEGRARLAPNRVGIFGFSVGATTALVSIGGEPDLARISAQCARAPEFVCQLMRSPAAGAALASPQWVHDPRIAAAVVAAPGLGFAFEPLGLANVRVPVQLWAGGADETVPYATNAAVVRRLLRGPVDFHSVPGAIHLSFLAPCGPDSPPQICADGPGFDRTAFHRELNGSIVAFFRRHLIESAPAARP